VKEPEREEFAFVSASFVVAGFLGDPTEITKALGIEPDEVGRGGEVRHLSGSKRQYTIPASYWEIHAEARRSANCETFVEQLLSRIEPSASSLRLLPSRITKKIVLQISVGPDGRVPGLLLSSALASRLAMLGVDLELDFN